MLKVKLLTILLLGFLVFRLKYMVNHTSLEVKNLNFKITQSMEDLDILTAEYTYLQRPAHLLKEAKRLNLKPVKPDRIVLLQSYLSRFDDKIIENFPSNKQGKQFTVPLK